MQIILTLLTLAPLFNATIPCSKKTINGFDTTVSINTGPCWIKPTQDNTLSLKNALCTPFFQPSFSLLLPNSNTLALISLKFIQQNSFYYKNTCLSLLQSFWVNHSLILSPSLGLNLTWLQSYPIKLHSVGPKFSLDFNRFFSKNFSLSFLPCYCPSKTRSTSPSFPKYQILNSFNQTFSINFSKYFNNYSSFFNSSIGYNFSYEPLFITNSIIFSANYSI